MSRIDEIFARIRGEGRTALMPFVTAGYPSLDATHEMIMGLEGVGASIVELGIPFSDPIADGPVIAASMHEALSAGVTPGHVFDVVRSLRDRVGLGLIAMVSDSIVRRVGAQEFVSVAADAGIDGLIVPDIDLDDAGLVADLASARGMTFSLLVAPTTRAGRLERVVSLCSGFVYLLAREGITGEQDQAPEIDVRVEQLRQLTELPIAVGFGISTADHVRAVTRCADAAIVGSAVIRRMSDTDDPVFSALDFVGELATGLADRA